MRFLINRFRWCLGILAAVLLLCNCFVIWTAFFVSDETEAYAETDSGLDSEQGEDKAVTASSDKAVLDESKKKTEKKTSKVANIDTDKDADDSKEVLKQFSKDDWNLILVNKRHRIPEDYTFETGMVETTKGRMPCDERIAGDLSAMLDDAKEDGIRLIIISPYRSVGHQKYLFNRKIKGYMNQGESYLSSYYQTAQEVTIPGSSEHQIGLAMDITSEKYYSLNEGFGESDGGIWLAENCWKYGFVVRYPAGKEKITGIEYEPWHFRYVGKEAAEYMTKQGLCLEEFLELLDEAD